MFLLIVEDEPQLRSLLERAMRKRGDTITSFASAEELFAWPELADHEVDVLVCDLNLPGLDGAELGRRLRIVYPALRVVSMSGDPSAGTMLTKPFTAADLERAIAA